MLTELGSPPSRRGCFAVSLPSESSITEAHILPPGINKPTARERFEVDDCGNARRAIKPDEV
jgi:hypothetical protein